MTDSQKDWWAPIWCGLVADPDGTHVQRLGVAGWLLIYLIVHARRRTGVVTCHRSTIARRMGIPLRTVQRWLGRLEHEGYISVEAQSGVATIQVLRWKSLVVGARDGASHANSGAIGAKSGADGHGAVIEKLSNEAAKC